MRASRVPPGHELHDQKIHAVLNIEVEDRGDAGMGKPREDVGFSPETRTRRGIAQLAVHQLDGDHTVQVRVVGLPNLSHPARADAIEQPVAAEMGAGFKQHGVAESSFSQCRLERLDPQVIRSPVLYLFLDIARRLEITRGATAGELRRFFI